MSVTDEAVKAGAEALVQAETQGLCELGKVCSSCDCFPQDRDAYALANTRIVLEAASQIHDERKLR